MLRHAAPAVAVLLIVVSSHASAPASAPFPIVDRWDVTITRGRRHLACMVRGP